MNIVKWLREQEDNLHLFIPPHECENFGKAADEIERLRAENAVLLKGFENQQNKAKAALMKLEKGLNLL